MASDYAPIAKVIKVWKDGGNEDGRRVLACANCRHLCGNLLRPFCAIELLGVNLFGYCSDWTEQPFGAMAHRQAAQDYQKSMTKEGGE